MAKEKTDWQEVNAIIIASVTLGLVFGFDDGAEVFMVTAWALNFVQQVMISFLFLLLFVRITKSYSKRAGVTTKFSIWGLKRYGWRPSAYFKGNGIPIGVILPLFISIMSYGKVLFSAVLSPKFSHTKASRSGHKFEQPKESELASTSMVAPVTLTLIAIFLSALPENSLKNLIVIPFSIAFVGMLPIPGLNGATAFFGSPVRYLLVMVFIITTYFLVQVTTPLQAIMLGLISGIVLTSFNYIYVYIIGK